MKIRTHLVNTSTRMLHVKETLFDSRNIFESNLKFPTGENERVTTHFLQIKTSLRDYYHS